MGDNQRISWLCVLVASMLGAVAIIGALGIVLCPVLLGAEIRASGEMVAITSGAIGALSSFLLRVPNGNPSQAEQPKGK